MSSADRTRGRPRAFEQGLRSAVVPQADAVGRVSRSSSVDALPVEATSTTQNRAGRDVASTFVLRPLLRARTGGANIADLSLQRDRPGSPDLCTHSGWDEVRRTKFGADLGPQARTLVATVDEVLQHKGA
jgi:hypothetical protein